MDDLIHRWPAWNEAAQQWKEMEEVTNSMPWRRLPNLPDGAFRCHIQWMQSIRRYGFVVSYNQGSGVMYRVFAVNLRGDDILYQEWHPAI